jgi:hypothetical protein
VISLVIVKMGVTVAVTVLIAVLKNSISRVPCIVKIPLDLLIIPECGSSCVILAGQSSLRYSSGTY